MGVRAMSSLWNEQCIPCHSFGSMLVLGLGTGLTFSRLAVSARMSSTKSWPSVSTRNPGAPTAPFA